MFRRHSGLRPEVNSLEARIALSGGAARTIPLPVTAEISIGGAIDKAPGTLTFPLSVTFDPGTRITMRVSAAGVTSSGTPYSYTASMNARIQSVATPGGNTVVTLTSSGNLVLKSHDSSGKPTQSRYTESRSPLILVWNGSTGAFSSLETTFVHRPTRKVSYSPVELMCFAP